MSCRQSRRTQGYALTVCQARSSTYKGNSDYIARASVTGLQVSILGPAVMLNGTGGGTDMTNRYHAGGFNSIFSDGHVKWTRLDQTYKMTGNLVEWTMWDRRLAP